MFGGDTPPPSRVLLRFRPAAHLGLGLARHPSPKPRVAYLVAYRYRWTAIHTLPRHPSVALKVPRGIEREYYLNKVLECVRKQGEKERERDREERRLESSKGLSNSRHLVTKKYKLFKRFCSLALQQNGLARQARTACIGPNYSLGIFTLGNR